MRLAKDSAPRKTPEGRPYTAEAALTSREYRHQSGAWLKELARERAQARVLDAVEVGVEFKPVRRRPAK